MDVSQKWIITSIADGLDFADLLSLDCTCRDISGRLGRFEGREEAWFKVAQRQCLLLAVPGMDKATIKAALFAMQEYKQGFQRNIIMRNMEDVRLFIKGTEQMKKKEATHWRYMNGWKLAETILYYFEFNPEDVAAHLADAEVPIESLPVPVLIGEMLVVLTLVWSNDNQVRLKTHSISGPFQAFGVHLHSLSPALVMQQDFKLWNEQDEQKGSGVCCVLQKRAIFQEMQTTGLLCAGFVHDLTNMRICHS